MTNQDKILKLFLDSNNKTNEALFGIKEALESINDQNKLHCQMVQEVGNKTDRNYQDIIKMIASTNSLTSIFKWVLMALVAAIIVLAGAEQALKFIPFK
jgi:hypothetical protein